MPRVKPLISNPYERLNALIGGYRESTGAEWGEIAGMAKISRSCMLARRKNPGDYTLDELRLIRRGLGIPIDEMREVLPL